MSTGTLERSNELRTAGRRAAITLAGILTVMLIMLFGVALFSNHVSQQELAERTHARHAAIVTENVAATLNAADLQPQATEQGASARVSIFRAALESYRSLRSIAEASEGLNIVAHVDDGGTEPKALIRALRTLPDQVFPPGDDDVSIVRTANSLITAGRIDDTPGRGGSLLILEFKTTSDLTLLHALLILANASFLLGLLSWALLRCLIDRSVLLPVARIRLMQSRAARGHWTGWLAPSGSIELRRFADAHNAVIERGTRLWETIDWRAAHLTATAPAKSAEVARVIAEASRFGRFAALGSGHEWVARPVGAALILGCLLFAEICATLGVMGTDWRTSDLANPHWATAVLLCAQAIGLLAGNAAISVVARRLKGLLAVLATVAPALVAYLVAAMHADSLMLLAVARAASGFALSLSAALCLDPRFGAPDRHHAARRSGAMEFGSSLVLVGLTPFAAQLCIDRKPSELFVLLLIPVALALLISVAMRLMASGARATDDRPNPPPNTSPSLGDAVWAGSPISRIRARVEGAALATALGLAGSWALASDLSLSNRFIALCLLLSAVAAGSALAQTLGRPALRVAQAGAATITALGMLVLAFEGDRPIATLTMLFVSAIGLLSACAASMLIRRPGVHAEQPEIDGRSGATQMRLRSALVSIAAGLALCGGIAAITAEAPRAMLLLATAGLLVVLCPLLARAPRRIVE